MSLITVYDSNQSEDIDLKVNVFDNAEFNAFIDGSMSSFIYDGIEWTVSKSQSGGFTVVELQNNSENVSNLFLINSIFNYIDLGGYISGDDCVQEVFETPGQGIYRKDSSTTYPYIRYEYNEPLPGYGNYPISLNPSSGQSYGMSLGAGGGAFTYGKITTFEQGDLSFFGLVGIQCEPPTSQSKRTTITIVRSSGIASTNYVEVEKTPGEKLFEPIKDILNNVRGGGKKSGQKPKYESDALEQPGAPDESEASIVGSGYVNLYMITKANLAQVGHCLFSDTLWTWFQGLTLGDPLEGIISLCVFPYKPLVGNSEFVKLFKYSCTTASLGANASANPLTNQYNTVSFGSINVGELFESYLDYEATTLSLYLPFIGEVDIPISEVMGGNISVEYTIDFCTGACTANVLCSKNITLEGISTDTQYSQHAYQGNCACQVPLSSASYGSMVGSMINACAAGLSGNVMGAALGIAGDALNGSLTPTVKTKGNISANSGFCAVLYPYITITRPITAEPESYQQVVGYPSFMDATLATCQGLCVCDDINLSGLTGATDSEISRIKQMCKEGIYI